MTGTARRSGSSVALEGAAVTQFGKYQLFASLGRGGMADVFLAVARGQMGFNKLAVLKRLKPTLAEDAHFRTMFLDEAKLAARLNHPNIVHTYEVGEERGSYFIAMEYLEGQALNKVVKELIRNQQRMAPEIAVRIVADALAGLGHSHDLRDYDGRPLNVIHRDVSPHNIFVTYDGHTKLVDFGIAKAETSSTETEVGILKGKVAYMSPEQAMGHPLDLRSDLFAMGVVLWEILAQRRLMTGDNAAMTLHRLVSEPIPHIADAVPDLDIELGRIVMCALEKDANRRFQSAENMRDALEQWLASRGRRIAESDVARTMNGLFATVRLQVQKQVQAHMALIEASANPNEMEALAAGHTAGLLRLGMGGSGSGSGVVANYGGVPTTPASNPPGSMPSFPPSSPSMSNPMAGVNANQMMTGPHMPPGPMASGAVTGGYSVAPLPPMPSGVQPAAAPPAPNNSFLLVVTIGCFALAGLLIVMFGLKKAQQQPPPPQFTMPTAAESAPMMPATTNAPPVPTNEPAPMPMPSPTPTVAPTDVAPKIITPPKTKPAPAPRPAPAPAPAAEEPPAPSGGGNGFVTVSAYPWAKVTDGSRVVCPATPCNRVSMSAGTHTLTFENGTDPSQKQTVTVQIKPGETTPKNIGFK